jgi:carbonic anhydrase/SulP family sulfate permease
LAVVLTCIDSRTPSELVFDLGIGDIFSVRIAGNIAREKVLGSIEYSCVVAGARLIVVMGHTRCGAVAATVDAFERKESIGERTRCKHIDVLAEEISLAIDPKDAIPSEEDEAQRRAYVDRVAYNNMQRTLQVIREKSPMLDELVRDGKVAIVGAMYDVKTGVVEFCESDGPLSEPLGLAVPLAEDEARYDGP